MKTITAWEGKLQVEHAYTSGLAGEKTLAALKEKGVFLATECPSCRMVYYPGRAFCERCFAAILDNGRTVGPQGQVRAWSRIAIDASGKKIKPYYAALIQFEGSTTLFLHKLQIKKDPNIGLMVRPVLKDTKKRRGSVTDIIAFRPV